ncbi:transcriptional regulator containing an hth domain [Haemophilus influenzae]|uniref:Transcriptional regulator containing an hth domain n=1 Tax=Haemophilus influenzae TaxID=727 RepID=A0A2X1PLE1_HAEIF|nr:transcriptional regulator containing an hth domain [Haemophilus influenzae]
MKNVFLRVADSNRGPLTREQIKNLEYDKNIRLFEDEIVPDFNEEDLDQALLELYKTKVNFTSGDILDLLYKRNLLTKKEGCYQFKKISHFTLFYHAGTLHSFSISPLCSL